MSALWCFIGWLAGLVTFGAASRWRATRRQRCIDLALEDMRLKLEREGRDLLWLSEHERMLRREDL